MEEGWTKVGRDRSAGRLHLPYPETSASHRMSRSEAIPPTARAIALLLSSTPTVHDAQPGVLHQLLEFSHRYTAQILSDALVYAEHAGRPGKVEMEDITLAVQARVGWEFGGRVPKEVRPVHDRTVSKEVLKNL